MINVQIDKVKTEDDLINNYVAKIIKRKIKFNNFNKKKIHMMKAYKFKTE